jgi:modulator of FtsH protease
MVSVVVFLAGAFGFIYAIEKTKESITGVYVLLGFTFFMGLMLSRLLGMVLGFRNGGDLIMIAFGGTGAVFVGMATLATVIKRELAGMGKFLMIGLLLLIVAGLINLFVQSSALMLTLSVVAIGIFSAFVLYDLKRVIDGGETNYISATLAIYLDLYNIFQNLLAILGIFGGERD